jgi:nitroreductase
MSEPTPLQRIISGRRSIRRYLPQPVEREKVLACLEAARAAPSSQNSQPWRFVVIDDPDLKKRFADAAFSGIYTATRFANAAPVFVLILARLDFVAGRLGRQIQGVPYNLLDIGIAGEHFVLQAEELGLKTCWIGWFDVRKARRCLRIPRKYKIVAMLSLGYSDKRPPRDPARKPIEEIAWFNRIDG